MFEEIERSVKVLDDVYSWTTMHNNNEFQYYNNNEFEPTAYVIWYIQSQSFHIL